MLAAIDFSPLYFSACSQSQPRGHTKQVAAACTTSAACSLEAGWAYGAFLGRLAHPPNEWSLPHLPDQLLRIPVPRTWVNKGKHKAGTPESPGSLASGLRTLRVLPTTSPCVRRPHPL